MGGGGGGFELLNLNTLSVENREFWRCEFMAVQDENMDGDDRLHVSDRHRAAPIWTGGNTG